jgi:hypothetical protein
MLDERALVLLGRFRLVPAGRGEEPTAAGGLGQRRRRVEGLPLALEPLQPLDRGFDLPELDQRLGGVRNDGIGGRLPLAALDEPSRQVAEELRRCR